MSGGPISPGMTTGPGFECLSCFIETENGIGVGTTVLSSNTNWPNPLLSLQAYSTSTGIDTADVTDYTVDHIPGTPTVLFTKTFWTGPKNDFLVTPFYELNSLAVSSGDYTVEETQDNYNVDKTLLSQVNNSNLISVDTTDILPGMQVTGSTLVRCTYDQV